MESGRYDDDNDHHLCCCEEVTSIFLYHSSLKTIANIGWRITLLVKHPK